MRQQRQNRGVGTITDNDAQPTVTVANQTLAEGDGPAPTNMTLTVSLSAVERPDCDGQRFHSRSAQAPWPLRPVPNATCEEGDDYLTRTGAVTFSPSAATGVTPTTRTLTIPICGDLLDEANETFRVQLTSASGATLGGAAATGTITDNDPLPRLVISDQTVIRRGS